MYEDPDDRGECRQEARDQPPYILQKWKPQLYWIHHRRTDTAWEWILNQATQLWSGNPHTQAYLLGVKPRVTSPRSHVGIGQYIVPLPTDGETSSDSHQTGHAVVLAPPQVPLREFP